MSQVTVHDTFSVDAYCDVVDNLRPSDVAEAMCFAKTGAARDVTWPLLERAYDRYLVTLDNQPVFIMGTASVFPGVRQLFGFGTTKTPRVIPAVTRFTRNTWLPRMKAEGVRRIQVILPSRATQRIRWLQSLGMVHEATIEDFALTGEPLAQLAFTSKEFSKHVLRW